MKKILFLLVFVALVVSCFEKQEVKPGIVQYAESIMTQYPNYESNDIARDSLYASIKKRQQSIADLEGVRFYFSKLIENGDRHSALFESRGTYATIYPDGDKDIMASIQIAVLGLIDEVTAASLDSNKEYTVTGTLHAWDDKDPFFVSDRLLGIYFGTYILDEMKVAEVQEN